MKTCVRNECKEIECGDCPFKCNNYCLCFKEYIEDISSVECAKNFYDENREINFETYIEKEIMQEYLESEEVSYERKEKYFNLLNKLSDDEVYEILCNDISFLEYREKVFYYKNEDIEEYDNYSYMDYDIYE